MRDPANSPVTLAAQARVDTANASRYLTQLCKHWSHKFPDTTFTPERGVVPFGEGRRFTAEADPEGLILRVEAADLDSLTRMQDVVAEHLARFAFREDLGGIAWTRVG